MPVTVQGGEKLVVDPNMKEEASCAGMVCVVIDNQHELCCQDKQALNF